MSRLEQAVISVARFLEQHQIPYMVIGGVANVVWGIPRATLDVDLTVWVPEEKIRGFVGEMVKVFPSRSGDPLAFVKESNVLPLETSNGIRIDMIFGQLPYEEEAIQRAVLQPIEGMQVRVCSPEDLILHKVISERVKDRDDVRGIIQQQKGRLDRKYLDPKVKSLAESMNCPDIWSWYEQCLKGSGPR